MKLDPRALKCRFLGYSSTQKGYKCYSPIIKRFFCFHGCNILWTSRLFSQTQLQGEISGNSNQDQFWDIALPAHIAHPATNIALPAPVFESTTSTAPVTSGNSSPRTTVVPFESDSAPNLPAASTLEL